MALASFKNVNGGAYSTTVQTTGIYNIKFEPQLLISFFAPIFL